MLVAVDFARFDRLLTHVHFIIVQTLVRVGHVCMIYHAIETVSFRHFSLNRNPALGAYMRPDFIAIYYTKIILQSHNRIRCSGLAPRLMKQFWRMDQGSKAETLSSSSRCWTSQSPFFCGSSYMVLGPYPLCSFCGRFVVRQPGPWRRKRHFEANNFPFQANEGVLKSSRPPASIPWSGAGSPGHLTRLNCHFRRSFDRRRRPRSCAGNDQYEVNIIRIRA